METPRELMELITFNTQNLCSFYDRFSDLPEPIILHVFSFLGSNDIVRLCYVSRKFRKLCMSSPYLSFTLTFDSEKCTAKLQRFLKDFMSIHNAPEIHRIRLHWLCHSVRYDAKGSIFGLRVQKAVRNKVQELDIGVPVKPHKAFYLPAGAESLRVLKLKLQGGNLKSFASVFASLETLSLNSVNGIGNLNISSSSLKVLTIVCCADDEDGLVSAYPVTKDCKIFIDCSSLENLAISKCLFDGLHLNVNAPSLKGLEISDCKMYDNFDISISAEQLQTLTLTMQLMSLSPDEFTNDGLAELIDSVRYAKILRLSFQIIEALFIKDQLQDITFQNLEHLEVTVSQLNLDDITAIAAFLVESCSPKTLTLRCDPSARELCETESTNYAQKWRSLGLSVEI
ncbi:FBD-associated F-box protein At3g52670-like [Herrania umbratica]|uniref:FBD-associated F-box protein At3g52670-like n=1 Tax=Herrania umbratica TaxID=108875 RepID=A0A6J1BE48_9ROSI|nr:FBD-associated F-box protein At3g52670-like [Herrania umbratica]